MPIEWIEFVETVVFTGRSRRIALEEPLRELQLEIMANPEAGDLDPGTGGLRKIRVPDPARHKGKRSGARVHYLWIPRVKRVYLIFVCGKNDQDSLTADQKKTLKQVVDAIRAELASRL